jgi:hypothetical protein
VHALQDTIPSPKATDHLLMTYLLVVAQHKTIDSIALRYPSIGYIANNLGAEFDYQFADAIKNIYIVARDFFHSDSLKIWEDETKAIELDSIASVAFLDTIRDRIRCKFQPPYKRIMLTFEYRNNRHDELRDGFRIRENICFNDSICLAFDIPESWAQLEFIDSKAFNGECIKLYRSHLGYGREWLTVHITQNKRTDKNASARSGVRKFVYGNIASRYYSRKNHSKLLSNNRIVTDALPGAGIETISKVKSEAGMGYLHQFTNLYAFENYYIVLQISQEYPNEEVFDLRWNSIEPLFDEIIESVRFSFQ